MSKALIEKLKRARERKVEVAGNSFTIRRPTDAEVVAMDGRRALDYVQAFVVDWDLAELAVVPGGGPEKVPFDRDLWAEWVSDRPQIWEPLANALLEDYKAHVEARETAGKN